MDGHVESIWTTPEGSAPMESVESVEARPGGLVGDRYFEGTGYYSPFDVCEVTLVAAEALETIREEHGIDLTDGRHRRNVVTRGVDVHDLLGHRFELGDAVLKGTRPRPPCAHVEQVADEDGGTDGGDGDDGGDGTDGGTATPTAVRSVADREPGWVSEYGSAANLRYNPVMGPESAPEELWSTSVPDGFVRVRGRGDTVVLVDGENVRLVAYDAPSGEEQWTASFDISPDIFRATARTAIAGDALAVESSNGEGEEELALERRDTAWEVSETVDLQSSAAGNAPVFAGDRLLHLTDSESESTEVVALDVASGEELWRRYTETPAGTPTGSGGKVQRVAGAPGYLYVAYVNSNRREVRDERSGELVTTVAEADADIIFGSSPRTRRRATTSG